jgi:DNA gyrase/topoisomerase IV subunit B
MEPVFESQTKTKLGSADMGSEAGMPSVRTFIDFVKTKLDYLHKNTLRMLYCAKFFRRNGRKLSGIRKLAKDRAKKSNLHNKIKRLSRTSYGYETQETWKVRFFITGEILLQVPSRNLEM